MVNKRKILISGSNGLIGRHLIPLLRAYQNEDVIHLVRHEPENEFQLQWSIENGIRQLDKTDDIFAVIHLAGKGIADERWNAKIKQEIRQSRVPGTQALCDSLRKLDKPPQIFIGASAVGYYGDRGDEMLTEDSPPGTGFLPDVCVEWENASQQIEELGTRRVLLRYGVVLSKRGGALKQMLPIFKAGGGGKLGSGNQYMSWIGLEDAAGIIMHALTNKNLNGPVNAVSPNPITNKEFTQALGRLLKRPAIIPAPAFGLKLMFGEMAEALLLSSARVKPEKLIEQEFLFMHSDLESALKYYL